MRKSIIVRDRIKRNDKGYVPIFIGIIVVGVIIYFMIKKNNNGSIAQVNNLETWQWEDWRGRSRRIDVHREVKGK